MPTKAKLETPNAKRAKEKNSVAAVAYFLLGQFQRDQRREEAFVIAHGPKQKVIRPRVWRVLATIIDVTSSEPEILPSHTKWETIDTEQNELFRDCETAWDIEDRYMNFWNRLNPRTEFNVAAHYLHNPMQRVVVLRVEEKVR
jgi:hypothetical protein